MRAMESFLPPELAASWKTSFFPSFPLYIPHCNGTILHLGNTAVLNHSSSEPILGYWRMTCSRMISWGFLVAVLGFMLLNPISAGTGGGPFTRESPLTMEMRKMLRGRLLNGEYHQLVAAGKGGDGGGVLNEELRMVPSGPDPLHHHGASPKKPQTP